jgi:hypothetical protein
LTAQEDGSATLDDGALLKRATELGRILVTQDDDLLREGTRLQVDGIAFCGVVYAHQLRVTIGQMVEDLDLIANATTQEEWLGRIQYLPFSGLASRRTEATLALEKECFGATSSIAAV